MKINIFSFVISDYRKLVLQNIIFKVKIFILFMYFLFNNWFFCYSTTASISELKSNS